MGLSKKTALNDNDILAAILRIDGSGSGIDADMVDGSHAGDLVPSIDPITKHWIIQNTDTGILAEGTTGAAGTNGTTPHIDSTTKHWFIGAVDTGILAEGTNGTNGTNGITPHIDPTTKHWFIGTTDTGIVAEAVDGTGSANVYTYNATITSTWTGSEAPYTQDVSISGILSSDVADIIPIYNSTLATALTEKEAWNKISKAVTGTDKITFTCFADKPITAISIQIRVVR